MPQWPRTQSARRAGLAWAAVRLVTACTVTVRQRRLVERVGPAGDPQGLGGVGEVQAGDGGDLQAAGLHPAVYADTPARRRPNGSDCDPG
jgi:hypothetical protein